MKFSQPQNEALVRLLIAARFGDARLSLAEGEDLSKRLSHLAWTSGTGLSVFIGQATADVRKAMAFPAEKTQFLSAQCAAFDTPESRKAAVQQIEGLLQSDGTDARENAFLQDIRRFLGA